MLHPIPKDHAPETSLIAELLHLAPDMLPILQQSCIRILDLTADHRSSASDVGAVIMRDQSLTTHVIKIANSAAYHTRFPIRTPTQAVTMIGFDVIRSIVVTAQLVEQAQAYGADTTRIKRLLARSLVAATVATEWGNHLRYPESGALFTNAMLFTLGDLVLALCRPDLLAYLEDRRIHNPEAAPTLERELLGRPLRLIGAAIAKQWHLPDHIIHLLQCTPILSPHRLETLQSQLAGLVSGANELARGLLLPGSPQQAKYIETLMATLTAALGISRPHLIASTVIAFQKAREFSTLVNIPQLHFLPKPLSLNVTHSFYAQLTRAILETVPPSPETPASHVPLSTPPADCPGHSADNTSLAEPSSTSFILDFTLQSLELHDPNTLFVLAAEGLHRACGFSRVVLLLVVPSSGTLEARIAYGPNIEALLPVFRCRLTDAHILVHLLHEKKPVKIASLSSEDPSKPLPAECHALWGDAPCLIGPLSTPARAIGLLLADRGPHTQHLTDAELAMFTLIVTQLNATLLRLAQ